MICVDQVNESAITTCIKTNIICYSLHLLPPPLFSSSASISSIYSSTSFPLYPHPLSLPHSLILLLVLQSPSILPPLSTLSFLPPSISSIFPRVIRKSNSQPPISILEDRQVMQSLL